jgi:glycosyltransferase involved in cell wall biosynthesis
MRILVLHSRYLSGATSGENRVVEDEVSLLREAGHEVRAWTPTFPGTSGPQMVTAGMRAVWSQRAVARVRTLLRERTVDVVHVHNLFPMLSPAVLREVIRQRTALVVTLHNFRLMCLPATLLRDGRVCEDCIGRPPWPGVLHRCYRSSFGASAALATSLTLHRTFGTFREVGLYLAVSDFVRMKHEEAGLEPHRIRVKPNFAPIATRRQGAGRYFLYLGRLSREKGVDQLLHVWKRIDAPLVVAGDGPERSTLEHSRPERVHFLGQVSPEKAARLIGDARAVMLPSTCYEGAPRAIPEAYAAGVPVITSRLGGLPESVDEDRSGLLVAPGDPSALLDAAIRLLDDDFSNRLGDGAYRLWTERYSPSIGLNALEDAYRTVSEHSSDGT